MPELDKSATASPARPDHAGWRPGADPLRVWAVAAVVGLTVTLALPAHLGWAVRAVAAWDLALVILVGLPWRVILRSDADRTRQRAGTEDPGRVGVFVISLVASTVGLVAALLLVSRPAGYAPEASTGLLVGLAALAVIGAWALVHTAFALHYARLYYADADDGAGGGLHFTGGPPDDLDFAYFAFGVGMTYQVPDVTVTSKSMRRVVLLHEALSFVYNTTILALAISLLARRL